MHIVRQYLWHWLTAVNDHSLQAPFIYDFYNRILKSKKSNEDAIAIENIRQELLKSKVEIEVESYGATSKVSNKASRPVSAIARHGITSAETSQLLNRIIKEYELKSIVELGTSFGLNTMYMALDKTRTVTSFEGCHNTLELAKENFKKLDYQNITTIEGNIDETLPAFLSQLDGPIDFAYLDANHRLEPTLNYFELLYAKAHQDSIFVIDDIHWSAEMSEAWKTIIADQRVTLSVDLFDIGIIFFRQELSKEHYRIRY